MQLLRGETGCPARAPSTGLYKYTGLYLSIQSPTNPQTSVYLPVGGSDQEKPGWNPLQDSAQLKYTLLGAKICSVLEK